MTKNLDISIGEIKDRFGNLRTQTELLHITQTELLRLSDSVEEGSRQQSSPLDKTNNGTNGDSSETRILSNQSQPAPTSDQIEVEYMSSFPQQIKEANQVSTSSSRTSSIRTAFSMLSKTSQGLQLLMNRYGSSYRKPSNFFGSILSGQPLLKTTEERKKSSVYDGRKSKTAAGLEQDLRMNPP